MSSEKRSCRLVLFFPREHIYALRELLLPGETMGVLVKRVVRERLDSAGLLSGGGDEL
jgi:hypothetical protein